MGGGRQVSNATCEWTERVAAVRMALVKQFSCGSLFSDDGHGHALGPEDLDDAAFVDDTTMDLDQDLGADDGTFLGLCVGPAVACPQLSMDGATSAWEAQRTARRSVLERQMSTEAALFGSTQELYVNAPPVSPPPLAGGGSDDDLFLPHSQEPAATAPIMIPTESLMRTDCLHASWGTHSADVFAAPEDPLSTGSAELEDDSMNAPPSYCYPHPQQGVVNTAGLWSQIYDKARPLARSVAANTPGPRASESSQLHPHQQQDQLQSQQKKKRRVVPKDRPKPKPWSEDELQQFRRLLKREGANNWAAKAVKLGTGRSAKSLHTRWLREEGRIIDRPRTVAAMAMNAHKAAATATKAVVIG